MAIAETRKPKKVQIKCRFKFSELSSISLSIIN
jgi:hypothetical protein